MFRISSSFTVAQQYISKVFPIASFKRTFFNAVRALDISLEYVSERQY